MTRWISTFSPQGVTISHSRLHFFSISLLTQFSEERTARLVTQHGKNKPKATKRESVTKTRHLCRNIHLPAMLQSLTMARLLGLSPQRRFLIASDLEGIVTPLAHILCNVHISPPIVWDSYKPTRLPVPHCVCQRCCFFRTPPPPALLRSPFSAILLHILRRRVVSRTADCFAGQGHC